MNTDVILINSTNKIPLSESIDTLPFIPRIGEIIEYRTFRKNNFSIKPVYDYVLKVERVVYDIEEDYNDNFDTSVKVYCVILEKTEVLRNT